MKLVLLDMVWPAIYVSETFWKFWFLVVGTIIIELFVIKYFLKFSWKKSFLASLVGNCVSGFIGTLFMTFAMLFWHLFADMVLGGTFNIVNWIATYVLMCLGSVFLETLAIKIIYNVPIRKLFLPMMVGNVLSYIFIVVIMVTATNKDPDEASAKEFKYLPNRQQFTLLDSSILNIDTSTIRVSYDKSNKRLNDEKHLGYTLIIPFTKQHETGFQFDFGLPGRDDQGGIGDNIKELNFQDLKNEYQVILEQKNPDTSLGWTKKINTDTLIFRRVANQ
jgi:hypothetical protein